VSDTKVASHGQDVGQRAPADQGNLPAGTVGGEKGASSSDRQLTGGRQQRAVDVEREQTTPIDVDSSV
jgi:hypothetical protein